jgi:hypothetical protein
MQVMREPDGISLVEERAGGQSRHRTVVMTAVAAV